DRLHRAQQSALRAQAAEELHTVCEQVRPLYVAEVLTPGQIAGVEASCGDVWAHRRQMVAAFDGQPAPEWERQWRTDLLDLAVIAAPLGGRPAPPGQAAAAHRRALGMLDEAEALLGPSGVLDLERVTHARALGLNDVAGAAAARARSLPPQSAWEHL